MTLGKKIVVDALPNYEVHDELGRGGWAVVLHARHRILDREVAVKHLPVAFGADPVVRARFIDEARLVARLDHPHIAPVYDFVEQEGTCLIVMEFLAGGSLWDRFQNEGVRFDEACAYLLVAASALEHAHEAGVLHRDIKPQNFLFDDRPGVIKLSDFGIAKSLGSAAAAYTAAGQVVGTPAYMAPEQILGQKATPATDVYACGTMLFELLTGELPYPEEDGPIAQLTTKVTNPARDITSVQPSVPAPIAAVVMRSLALDPADRQPTARRFGEELAEAATEAFGPGWLRRTGVVVDGAPHLIAIVERTSTGPTRPVEVHDVIRATTVHTRLGELVDEARTRPAGEASPNDEARDAAAPADVAAPPAGWYADPLGRFEHRYWDGDTWTGHVATAGAATTDPLD